MFPGDTFEERMAWLYEISTKPNPFEIIQEKSKILNQILEKAGALGVLVYVFSYPIYPYSESGIDYDMVSYALVKSFPSTDERSKQIPSWEPKKAFYRVGEIFSKFH